MSGSVVQVFEPPDGGVPEYVAALTEGLVARGWHVKVVAPKSATVLGRLLASGADVDAMPISRYPSPSDLSVVHKLIGSRDRRPDVIHGHSTKASLLAGLASMISASPSVYSPHFWAFERDTSRLARRATGALERRLSRVHREIIAVAENERREGESAHIRAPIRVVPTGIPDAPPEVQRADARRSLGLAADARVAVWVGRRAPQKRPEDLAPLAAALLAEGVDLVALGRDLPGSREGRAFSAAGGRLVTGVRPGTLYAAADVLVQTSAWESAPLTILEAMRAGLPVVAYGVGGVSSYVEDGVTGHLVPVADHEELARRATLVVQSAAQCESLSAAGRQRFEALFSFDRMVDSIAAVYQSLISRSPRL